MGEAVQKKTKKKKNQSINQSIIIFYVAKIAIAIVKSTVHSNVR